MRRKPLEASPPGCRRSRWTASLPTSTRTTCRQQPSRLPPVSPAPTNSRTASTCGRHDNRRGRPGRPSLLNYCSDRADVLRLQALRALSDLELDPLVLVQGAEALRLDRRVVHEHVGPAVLLGDEAEALLAVEPLNCSQSHVFLLKRQNALRITNPRALRQRTWNCKTATREERSTVSEPSAIPVRDVGRTHQVFRTKSRCSPRCRTRRRRGTAAARPARYRRSRAMSTKASAAPPGPAARSSANSPSRHPAERGFSACRSPERPRRPGLAR